MEILAGFEGEDDTVVSDGVPRVIEPEETRKIIVGRYAYRDVCKCGAPVHVSPDEPGDKPAEIFYDRATFQILACPKCIRVMT